jgi:L,D-peptidoglycan transpeptidase YkuD (ErfK/YbiS/YcfS/YnhG family)
LSPGYDTGTGYSNPRRREPDQPTLLPESPDSTPGEGQWPQASSGQYNGGQYDNRGYDNGGYGQSQYSDRGYDNGGYNQNQYANGGHDHGGYDAGQHLRQQQPSRRQLRGGAPRRRTGLRIAQIFAVAALATALVVAVLAFLFPGTLPGTTSTSSASPLGFQSAAPTAEPPAKVGSPGTEETQASKPEPESPPSEIPGLGPKTLAKIPAGSRQVVVTTGRAKNSSYSRVTLYQRTSQGWRAGTTWQARNGRKGWTAKHHEDDLRSPIGVFALTDTGGLLPDVGTKMPYYRSNLFTIDRIGMLGQPLAGSYDYVIAINYNRRPGHSPLDKVRPLGKSKGGGIWLHVRSDGPTQACVSLTRGQMRTLVKTLDPAKKPYIVMGDLASLQK